METINSQWLSGRVGGMEEFWSSESIVCIILSDVIIHLSEPIKCTTSRVNSNLTIGPWMIKMCQCRYIDCNKCAPLAGMLLVGRLCMCGVGQRVYRN